MGFSDSGITPTMNVTPTYGGGGGFGGFGDNSWWIILFLIFGLFGWGGYGGFGGNGGGMNGGVGSEVQRGFDHSSVVSKLDGITQGICDSTYALNNAITNGFHGVDSALCNLGYQTQSGFNALSAQLAQCCCDTREAISGVRYDMATQACDTRHAIERSTRDIIDNSNANSRAILDFLTQDKISTLQAENTSLKFAASQAAQTASINLVTEAQTAELIRRLGRDVPVPAYVVPNPNCCYPSAGYGYGFGNGCGCAA